MRQNTPNRPTGATIRSKGALALGLFCATVTAAILLDDVRQGGPVTLNHILSGAVLVIALASGHMAWPYVRQGNVLGLAFGVIFLGATGYLVVSSGSRNAEVAGTKAAGIVQVNKDRVRIEGELRTAKGAHTAAQDAMTRECSTGKGKRCEGTRTAADALGSHVALLEARLDGMKPAQDSNAGYRHAAKVLVAAGIGSNANALADRLALVMPFALVLVIELATICFMGAALGHSSPASGQQQATQADAPSEPTPPTGGRKTRKQDARGEVIQLRKPMSQETLAARWRVTEACVSNWVREWETQGVVTRRREGRCQMVANAQRPRLARVA